MTLPNVLLALNVIAAVVILINGLFFVINRMSRHTRHGMRVAWLILTTGALGVAVSPLYCRWQPTLWETILIVGVALHFVFERRLATCSRSAA